MSKFFAGNYGLMRHAKDRWDAEGDTILTSAGTDVCIKTSSELAGHLQGKRTRIFHSPKTRAQLTALLVRNTLRELGVEVEDLRSLRWLDSDSHAVNDENIRATILDDEETFFLFITHMPQIVEYLGLGYKKTDEPLNSAIISRDFQIAGE